MASPRKMEPSFRATGQEVVRSDYWLKAIASGTACVSLGLVIGVTQKFRPLMDLDKFEMDDESSLELVLTTLLPALVLMFFGFACSGPMAARIGGDMLEEMSKDMDPKDSVRSCLTNAGLVLALILTMVIAALQQDFTVQDGETSNVRFEIWYRLLNFFAAECAIRGLIMCVLVLLYMEPLDSKASMDFACDNLQYLGEPITAMMLCIVYFVNMLLVWEFGTDGLWTGILVSVGLGYSLIRMFVVFFYLSSWQNPQLSAEDRQVRKERTSSIAAIKYSTVSGESESTRSESDYE